MKYCVSQAETETSKMGGARMGGLRRGYSNATPPSDVGPKQSTAQRNQAPAVAKIAGRQGGKGLLLKQRKVEETGKLEKVPFQFQRLLWKRHLPAALGTAARRAVRI